VAHKEKTFKFKGCGGRLMESINKYMKFLFDNGVPIDKDPKQWKDNDFVLMEDLNLIYNNLDSLIPAEQLKKLFDEVENKKPGGNFAMTDRSKMQKYD
jgi:hypothetical protein